MLSRQMPAVRQNRLGRLRPTRGRGHEIGARVGPLHLRRGDLVFWDGHVGIMTSRQDLVHASAYHMVVVEEPLAEARARIAASVGGDVTGVRRPLGLGAAGL